MVGARSGFEALGEEIAAVAHARAAAFARGGGDGLGGYAAGGSAGAARCPYAGAAAAVRFVGVGGDFVA